MKTDKWGLYEYSVVLFFLAAPAAAILIEQLITGADWLTSVFKWFVFFGIGCRLGTAGINQMIRPQFTAKEIFKMTDEAVPIVREIGFANVCFGLIAILSLFIPSFRIPAAVAGGLYFGLAGLLHVFKQRETASEVFAMVSDFFIFAVLTVLLLLNL